MRLLISTSFFLFMTSCATQLTNGGDHVQILYGQPSRSCTMIRPFDADAGCYNYADSFGRFSADDVDIILRNKASTIGATHIIVTRRGVPCGQGSAVAFKCPETYGLSKSELLEKCNSGVATACADYAAVLRDEGGKVKDRQVYYERACKLGFEKSCTELPLVRAEVQFEESLDAATNACDGKGNARACADASVQYLQIKNIDAAQAYASKACINGDQGGCELQRTIAADTNTHSAGNGRATDPLTQYMLIKNALPGSLPH